MSTGEKFVKKEENPSIENRLSVLEQKIPAYITKIQGYDHMLEECKHAIQEISLLNESAKEIFGQVHQLSQVFKELKSRSEAEQDTNKKLIDSLTHKLEEQKNKCESLEKLLIIYSSRHEKDIKRLNEELSKKLEISSSAVLDKLNMHMNNSNNAINSVKSELTNHKLDVGQKNNELSSFLNGLEKTLTETRTESYGRYQKVEAHLDELENALISMKHNINSQVKSEEYQPKREVPELSLPAIVKAVKDDMKSMLDDILIDCNNASQRSKNQEKKILFLEKRVDSANLAIQSIELNKKV